MPGKRKSFAPGGRFKFAAADAAETLPARVTLSRSIAPGSEVARLQEKIPLRKIMTLAVGLLATGLFLAPAPSSAAPIGVTAALASPGAVDTVQYGYDRGYGRRGGGYGRRGYGMGPRFGGRGYDRGYRGRGGYGRGNGLGGAIYGRRGLGL